MSPAISRARAMAVEEYLRLLLHRYDRGAVSMSIRAAGGGQSVASDSARSGRSRSRRVVANIN
jgi:outer membrane protein OmpA-like peptidoglycan-associated protein